VKRFSFELTSLIIHLAVLLALLLSLTSCSWLKGKREVVNDSGDVQTVPKAQYDQLLKKYESVVDTKRDENVQKEEPQITSVEGGEVADIDKEKAELIETVNLFDTKSATAPKELVREENIAPPISYDNMTVENQLVEIRRCLAFIGQNKIDEAMTKLKQLEQSNIPQVKVRSKFLVAELLFQQGEFDLAMQIYEEVITNHAFSGVVLKSLGRLVVCAEKLKLTKKKDQYYSLLHDFFEAA